MTVSAKNKSQSAVHGAKKQTVQADAEKSMCSGSDSDVDRRRALIQAALEANNAEDGASDGDSGSNSDGLDDSDMSDTEPSQDNRKISTGSFKSMGLMSSLLKAVQKKGFRQPTPIQRKAIGPLLQGRDVVGMARTGSGKTAAFIIPLIQKLKAHSVKVGLRGLVLVPTRELALQILAFTKLMTKLTDLRTILLVGGDSFEEQFSQLASNPDIVIATPGRLLHLCIETQLSLSAVEMVVFDEADRLFELGFAEQLQELLARMPPTRQTALFSATLPKGLVDFAAAGLSSPVLVRLDGESKLSADLQCSFLAIQTPHKDAALLYLLKTVISPGQLTLIFAATRHHVEYLQTLLRSCGYHVGYVYGSMDQEARELAIANFRSGKWSILIVTDVAARGIDIPLLDHVINYDFPGKAKLFVHRVGRVARAGRTGSAYSLVASDEIPYLIDLQLFLGQKLQLASLDASSDNGSFSNLLGSIPIDWLVEEEELVRAKNATVPFLEDLKKVTHNAYKLYYKTRSAATPDAHIAAKKIVSQLAAGTLGTLHPLLQKNVHGLGKTSSTDQSAALEKTRAQASMIAAIRAFKPKQAHAAAVIGLPRLPKKSPTDPAVHSDALAHPDTADAASLDSKLFKDDDYYLPYAKAGSAFDAAQERGYSVREPAASFLAQASSAVLDLVDEDDNPSGKRRRLIAQTGNRQKRDALANQKYIKTENGTRVPASYASQDLYKRWMKKTHLTLPQVGESELGSERVASLAPKKRWVTKKTPKNGKNWDKKEPGKRESGNGEWKRKESGKMEAGNAGWNRKDSGKRESGNGGWNRKESGKREFGNGESNKKRHFGMKSKK